MISFRQFATEFLRPILPRILAEDAGYATTSRSSPQRWLNWATASAGTGCVRQI